MIVSNYIPLYFKHFVVVPLRKSKRILSRLSLLFLNPKELFVFLNEIYLLTFKHKSLSSLYLNCEKMSSACGCSLKTISMDHAIKSIPPDSILYIDRGGWDYDELLKILQTKRCSIVFRLRSEYDKFNMLMVSERKQEDFDLKVTFVQPIDMNLDESIYSYSDHFSEKLINCLTLIFKENTKYKSFAISLQGVRVAASDQIATWVRVAYFIKDYLSKNKVKNIYFMSNEISDIKYLFFYIEKVSQVNCVFIKRNNRLLKLRKLIFKQVFFEVLRLARSSFVVHYFFSKIDRVDENYSVVIGNFKSSQYREALIPFLEHFTAVSSECTLVLPLFDNDIGVKGRGVACVPQVLIPNNFGDLSEKLSLIDCSLAELIEFDIDNANYDYLLEIYISLSSKMAIYQLINNCYSLKQEIDDFLQKANITRIISSPGRTWVSQFLVNYLDDVPSFEIQSGPISISKRFKSTGAKFIFANDEVSKDIYVNYLGYDYSNVKIVGSPRMDLKLSSIRSVSLNESRLLLSIDLGLKVICIVTQPCGLEIMSSMVEEVIKATKKNKKLYLLVCIHPNENKLNENHYKNLLESSFVSNRYSILSGSIYHAMNASDFVVTYYSTSGLEAFSLDKTVLSFRPKSIVNVPFDLCELGIAVPFSNSYEFDNILNFEVEINSRGKKQYLIDGKSVERITDFIQDNLT